MGDKIERDRLFFEGEVTDFNKDKFRVTTKEGLNILCILSGKIRQNSIKILLGDRVRVEASQYDTSQGRIVQRIR